MPRERNVTIHDRFGNRLRARMLGNGHVLLCEHANRYTYARINRRGEVELYDGDGNFSYGSLDGTAADGDTDDDADGALRLLLASAA